MFTFFVAVLCLVPLAGVAENTHDSHSAPTTLWDMPPESADTPGGVGGSEAVFALQRAYPNRISEAGMRSGDWALKLDDTWYYWAGGRLLPESALSNADAYDRVPFYRYPDTPPEPPEYSEAERVAVEERTVSRLENPPNRHPGFYNALWRISDAESAWERQKTTYFLGLRTAIHREILEDLARVEEEILKRAETDRDLAAFIDEIVELAGFNFRRVDGARHLSNHAYGIAVDILPLYYNRKPVYWLWSLQSGVRWYEIAPGDRFRPPDAFVEAFERQGFVWGGKWRHFDTIHFEYRPEILILGGYDVPGHR